MDIEPVQVIIHGRNLRELYDEIFQHRCSWIAEAARGRDFSADGEPIVTRIEIEPLVLSDR
jgi:hypothetical protein